MPYSHGVDNYSQRFYKKGRQWNLGESISPTQIFQWNLLLASHQLWVYVCAFGAHGDDGDDNDGDGDGVDTVMVLIVPEALRQVDWLRQH
jgi:hypothetical protein